jgi:hypothetical protein
MESIIKTVHYHFRYPADRGAGMRERLYNKIYVKLILHGDVFESFYGLDAKLADPLRRQLNDNAEQTT